jgi:hypothetical protein
MMPIARIFFAIALLVGTGGLYAQEMPSSGATSWRTESTVGRSSELSRSAPPADGKQGGMDSRGGDPNRRPGGPGDPPMLMSPMPLGGTTETLQMPEIFRFAATEFPDLQQRLEKGRGVMPMQEVHEVTLYLKRMQDLQESNPEMYQVEKSIHQLEVEADSLSADVRKSPGKDTAKLRDTLKTKLGGLFDLREKKRELEARQIEQELKNIREILAKRQTNREAIIQKRLKELCGDNEGQEW